MSLHGVVPMTMPITITITICMTILVICPCQCAEQKLNLKTVEGRNFLTDKLCSKGLTEVSISSITVEHCMLAD